MKSKTLTCITAMTLFAALAIPVRLTAQGQKEGKKDHHRYKLIDLGTFGGPASYINPTGNGGPYMNREGAVVGSSQTSIPPHPNANGYPCPGPPVFHAMEWADGVVTDLASLGEADNCGNALAINDAGEIVGASENGTLDPATGVVQLRAVLWQDGQIKDLGTFGGNQSFAGAINNRGQIAGFALNEIPDPYSLFDVPFLGSTNGTETRAFLWQDGQMQDLGTLGGPDAFAMFVNEHGQVAGVSYTDSTPNPTTGVPTLHPFLWKNGQMKDLGSFGGSGTVLGNDSVFVVGLNNRGQAIGISPVTGDQYSDPFVWDGEKLIDLNTQTIGGNPITANGINDAGEIVGGGAFPSHPFDAYLWKNGVAADLGALAGDCFSQASAINSRGQIVGNSLSCDFSTLRSFLWEEGSIVDLGALISPNSGLQLVETNVINDRGEIAGNGFPPGCTDFSCTHAYVLIPCDGDHADNQGCEDSALATTAVTQSNPATVTPASINVIQDRLTPEMLAALRTRFGRLHGFGAWRRK